MDNETLDQDIRAATEPDPATVDRLTREALREDRATRRTLCPMLTTIGVFLLSAGAVLYMLQGSQRTLRVQTSVTNVGDTIVVKPSSGGVWLIGGDAAAADRLATGTVILYTSGEGR